MPSIGLFTAAPQATQPVQPMADPTMPNMPAQQGSGYSGMNAQTIAQLAKILGDQPGSQTAAAPLPQQIGANALGNNQDTSQMTPSGYPVGGTGQMINNNGINSQLQLNPYNLYGASGGQ